MTECRTARRGEEAAQKKLWAAAFGDSVEYIESFYKHLYSPERMAVLTENGALAAMCALLPCEIALPGGGAIPAAYLYALATDPARRGRGYARRLLAWSEELLSARGAEAIVTVPATESLRGFYARAGYTDAFFRRVLEFGESMPMFGTHASAPPSERLVPLSPAEYAAARAALLAGRPYVAYDADYITHWARLGRLFRVERGEKTALAAVELGPDGTAVVQELLAPGGEEEWVISALAAAMLSGPLRVCLPPRGGAGVPFGMLRPLTGLPPVQGGYLAFALD